MAEHEVGLKIPKEIEIVNRDIKIVVRRGVATGECEARKEERDAARLEQVR